MTKMSNAEKLKRKEDREREKKILSILGSISFSYWRSEDEDGRWGRQITEIDPRKLAEYLYKITQSNT